MFFYNLEIKMKTEEQTKYYNTPGEVLKKIKSRIYDLSVSYDSNEYMRVKDNFIAFINEMNENFKILKIIYSYIIKLIIGKKISLKV